MSRAMVVAEIHAVRIRDSVEIEDHSLGTRVHRVLTPAPSSPLFGLVRSIWYWEESHPASFLERILPSGELSLLVNLEDDELRHYEPERPDRPRRLPAVAIHGLHTQPFLIDTEEQRRIMGVVFNPGGAYPFLRLPMSELHNLHVGVEEMWGALANELRDRALEAPSDTDRLLLVRDFLSRLLSVDHLLHRGVRHALHRFERAGAGSIGQLRDEIGLSHRRFGELFKRQVGCTPKQYHRVVRLSHFIQGSKRRDRVDLASLALDCGYYDQAHLTNEFQKLTGLTPARYLAMRPDHGETVPHVPVDIEDVDESG